MATDAAGVAVIAQPDRPPVRTWDARLANDKTRYFAVR